MQLDLPFLNSTPAVPPPASLEEPVQYVRMRRARRYILRVRPDGTVRVTIPRGGSRAEAAAFMRTQAAWVARERQRVLRAQAERATAGGQRAERDLQARASELLLPRLLELAREHGLSYRKVTIRNQRSRWGSCSRTGAISLNYRLVQMPEAVRDYVLIHELMHLKQQNHGPKFWRLVEQACPEFREAERWLRKHGRSLL